jgi:choline-glycine betaine transporter
LTHSAFEWLIAVFMAGVGARVMYFAIRDGIVHLE